MNRRHHVIATLAVAAIASGAAGVSVPSAEWRVSSFELSSQHEASLDVARDGSLAVVWSSRRQQGGRAGIFAQRFDGDGRPVDGERSVNLWKRSHQTVPAIARGEKAWWIVWQSHGQDGDAGSVMLRRYDDAFEGGSEVLVNEHTTGHQHAPVVVASPGGGAIVAWTSAGEHGAIVRLRRFDETGIPAGAEFGVCDRSASQSSPSIACRADGSFLVAYAVADAVSGVALGVRVQVFDAAGSPRGEPTPVDGALSGSGVEPVVTATPDGYVVAWHAASRGTACYGVRACLLDPQGTPRGAAFEVDRCAEDGGYRSGVALATDSDGGFVVAWNDSRDEGVHARRFAADGLPVTPAFAMTHPRAGRQQMRQSTSSHRLRYGADDRLYCVWSGDGHRGDTSAVHVTMLGSRINMQMARGVADTNQVEVVRGPAAHDELAAPHEPPTFDRTKVTRAPREIVRAAEGDGVDIGFTGFTHTGWNPPDPHMAVGVDHLVGVVNGAIAYFTKEGELLFQMALDGAEGFWGELGATDFVFDPEVLYDPLSGRFMAMASEDADDNQTFGLLAVSDDGDPNGPWHKYRFETTKEAGSFFDSPNLGVDSQAVYVSGDAAGPFSEYPIYIFDKASLLAGDPPAQTNVVLLPTETESAGLPPVMFDDPPALYLIEHLEGNDVNRVRLIAMQDPFGTPTFTEHLLPVPLYSRPEDPPQVGTPSRPNTVDARFWSAKYRHGSIWAVHHINTDRVISRWYEIAMNGWPDSGEVPSLVQTRVIDLGDPIRTFFPAIGVDAHRNVAVVFARSSPEEHISMWTGRRYASDPLGLLQFELAKESTSIIVGNRWGDYGSIEPDPVDGITMWAHHEWVEASVWRTWVRGFTPEFNFADIDFDGMVGLSDLMTLIDAWGPCDPEDPCVADLDGNGAVEFRDLAILLGQWGN